MKNKIKSLIKSKIFKNSIWLTILQVVNTVIPFITIPYITRVLGTSVYGNFSITLNWILYFQVLVEFGFGLSGSRKVAIAKDDKEIGIIFNNIISARIVLLSISFILMNIISLLFGFDKKMYVSMLLLFIMIIGTTFQLTWLFQGKQDMKFITIINVVSRMISIILIFLFVKNENDLYLYCILYSITLFLSSLISLIVAKKNYNLKFKFAKYKDVINEINEAKYLFVSSAMTKIFSGFGITVLGIFSSSNIVGIYSAIYKIPYILTMFFSPISQALYPFCSLEYKKDFNSGVKKVKSVFLPVFLLFLIPSLLIILFRDFTVRIVFGPEYSNYSFVMIPLVLQFLFAIINNFVGIQMLVASKHQKEYTKAFSIGCLAIVICNFLLGYYFSIYGVGIAALLGEFVLFVALMIQFKKIYNKEKKND